MRERRAVFELFGAVYSAEQSFKLDANDFD